MADLEGGGGYIRAGLVIHGIVLLLLPFQPRNGGGGVDSASSIFLVRYIPVL